MEQEEKAVGESMLGAFGEDWQKWEEGSGCEVLCLWCVSAPRREQGLPPVWCCGPFPSPGVPPDLGSCVWHSCRARPSLVLCFLGFDSPVSLFNHIFPPKVLKISVDLVFFRWRRMDCQKRSAKRKGKDRRYSLCFGAGCSGLHCSPGSMLCLLIRRHW